MIKLTISVVALTIASFSVAKPRILAVGDSLTEGYGLPKEESHPALLEKELKSQGYKGAVVVNAGTSGATTAFGIRTLKFHLKRQRPDLVIYALGGNDGLRGINPKQTKANIEEAINLIKKYQVKVVLAGMKAPPNYGRKFPKEFEAIFPDLSKKLDVPLIPFLLEGVAGTPSLNLPDGIHPNAKGYKVILKNVYPHVKNQL